ncbi:MAG: transglycosylase domain-containing protein [Clostridia bacterium]|nr:transglycosylase domain-containing protein [Clostridia bacterium]
MKQRKKIKKKRRLALILLCGVILCLSAATAAGAVWITPYAHAKMDMTLLQIPRAGRPSILYAYDPETRARRSGGLHPAENATLLQDRPHIYTPYAEIPPDLIHAFIAIEDKRFYTHRGVDPIRTLRAGLGYLRGNPTCGGSTITQQLVKNLTGRAEQTPERKLTEIFTALDLEKQTDKETVLEAYLNIINLAEGCFGVGMAAETYFQKSVSDLTLPECAAIAAITNNPTRYDPLTHPEANRARRDLILTQMAAQGYITEAKWDTAIATPLTLNPAPKSDPAPVTSWYADMVVSDVIRDLMDRRGYTYAAASLLVYQGGLTIETAVDETLQAIVESYYADLTHFPMGEGGRPQSSCILMDPRTGDILAVAGAVGEKTANRLQNYATDTRRPAGSCIKPLSVYAPALERGLITWAGIYEDEPLEERKGQPWPANADGLYRGRVTVGESVAHSLNPVAVRILEEVGLPESFSFARYTLGLHSLIPPDAAPLHDLTVSSLALGQQSVGVTSRELTAAYTALTDGVYKSPVSYHRVLDGEGNVLLENLPADKENPAISAETAAILTRLLCEVNTRGTAARYLRSVKDLRIESAGKTGTTQNNCDRRYVGYTPRLLAGVWMGYDYPTELRGIHGNPCVTIWDDLMAACETAYRGAPPKTAFDLPDTVTEVEFCPLSGCLPGEFCTHPIGGRPTERGWFVRGTEPTDTCTLHGEPPIPLVPHDPADPDRIPLLPNDLLPEDPAREPDPPRDTAPFPWFSRWFSRFSRRDHPLS